MKNMAFKRVGNVLVVVHNSEAPDNETWDAYLEATLALGRSLGGDLSKARQVVFTDGGGPNSAQRKAADEASKAMNGKKMPVAVVSASPMVRGIVTVFNWFNINMRSFAPTEMDQAFRFLGVRPQEIGQIWVEVRLLQKDLGGGALKSVLQR